MYLINKQENRITKLEEKTFSELGFRERDHLQEWIANNPSSLGEELLIIQKEFNGFHDTNERLDLLALDKQGNLVIIENKLDDSGRDVTWQALKYASYCSSLSKDQIKQIYQSYLTSQNIEDLAENNLSEFFDGQDYEEIAINSGTQQRVIMVARSFRKEVTSTVLWLINYKIRIQCFKVTPYTLGEQLFLNIEQILPVKETEKFQISMADKSQDDISSQESSKNISYIRQKFWSQLITYSNSKTKILQGSNVTKEHWIGLDIGLTGLSLNLVINRKYSRVEIHIKTEETSKNKEIFDFFINYKSEIEKEFGSTLIWERMDKHQSCRVKYQKDNLTFHNDDTWIEINNFLIDSAEKFQSSFREPIQKLISYLDSK